MVSRDELLKLPGLRAVLGKVRPNDHDEWWCRCEWEGRSFRVVALKNPSRELCRQLFAAGVPDIAMHVHDEAGKHCWSYLSIHAAALGRGERRIGL
jgi:hypothetical protein